MKPATLMSCTRLLAHSSHCSRDLKANLNMRRSQLMQSSLSPKTARTSSTSWKLMSLVELSMPQSPVRFKAWVVLSFCNRW
eukprot:scaffold76808_cov66-Phaeocystis_antarctica.AAC.4